MHFWRPERVDTRVRLWWVPQMRRRGFERRRAGPVLQARASKVREPDKTPASALHSAALVSEMR